MNVCVVNADGSGYRVTARRVDRPAWSPDGKTIAAHCKFQICLFGPDGKDFRTLTHVEGEQIFSDLVWSPDSKSIAVSQVGELGSTAMVVNAANGSVNQVARNAGIAGWTTDGKLVLAEGSAQDAAPTF